MFFNDWIDVILFRAQSKLSSITLFEGLKSLVIASLLLGFLDGIESFLADSFLPDGLGLGPGIILLNMVLFLIIYLIVLFVFGSLINFIAKLLGGRGNYKNFIGALALIIASFLGTIYVLLNVITIIATLFGFEIYSLALLIATAISFLVELWQLIVLVKATKQIHKLSTGRAILAVFGILLLLVVLMFLLMALAVIIGLLVFAASSSAAGPTGMALLPF